MLYIYILVCVCVCVCSPLLSCTGILSDLSSRCDCVCACNTAEWEGVGPALAGSDEWRVAAGMGVADSTSLLIGEMPLAAPPDIAGEMSLRPKLSRELETLFMLRGGALVLALLRGGREREERWKRGEREERGGERRRIQRKRVERERERERERGEGGRCPTGCHYGHHELQNWPRSNVVPLVMDDNWSNIHRLPCEYTDVNIKLHTTTEHSEMTRLMYTVRYLKRTSSIPCLPLCSPSPLFPFVSFVLMAHDSSVPPDLLK